MADVEVLGPGQRGLGHPAVGQRGERRVDLVRRGHGPRLCGAGRPGWLSVTVCPYCFGSAPMGTLPSGDLLLPLTCRQEHPWTGWSADVTPTRPPGPPLLVGDHLRRHAADPERGRAGARPTRVAGRSALASQPDRRGCASTGRAPCPTLELVARPATSRPTRTTDGVGRRRSATAGRRGDGCGEASDRSTCPSSGGCRRSSGPARRRRPWSTSTRAATGGRVAVALVAAREAHPTVTATAVRGAGRRDPRPGGRGPRGADSTPNVAAALIQEVHRALGSDAQVEVTGDGSSSCRDDLPVRPGVAGAPSLCHLTPVWPGRSPPGCTVREVVLDETLALRGPGLPPARPAGRPTTRTSAARATSGRPLPRPPRHRLPHLDLSLSLPERERQRAGRASAGGPGAAGVRRGRRGHRRRAAGDHGGLRERRGPRRPRPTPTR